TCLSSIEGESSIRNSRSTFRFRTSGMSLISTPSGASGGPSAAPSPGAFEVPPHPSRRPSEPRLHNNPAAAWRMTTLPAGRSIDRTGRERLLWVATAAHRFVIELLRSDAHSGGHAVGIAAGGVPSTGRIGRLGCRYQ